MPPSTSKVAAPAARKTPRKAPQGRLPASKESFTSPPPSPDDFERWQLYLAQRKSPALPRQLISTGRFHSLLAVGMQCEMSGEVLQLTAELSKVAAGGKPSSELRGKLTTLAAGITPPMKPVEWATLIIALAHALPKLASALPGATWCQLADELLREIRDTRLADEATDDPLVWLLAHVELPLTLAILFPEFESSVSDIAHAQLIFREGLADVIDEQGLVIASSIGSVGSIVAALSRLKALEPLVAGGLFNEVTTARTKLLVQNFLRLLYGKGQLSLAAKTGPQVTKEDRELLKLLLAMFPKSQRAVLEELLANNGNLKGKTTPSSIAPSSSYCEDSGVAIMRCSWLAPRTQVTVAFVDTVCKLEVIAAGDPIFSGEWPIEVTIDGTKATPADDWEEVLWHSDADVDYLEIEIVLVGGVRLQRQILLSRKDHALLLSEALIGEEVFAADTTHQLSVSTQLPLDARVHLVTERETRDARIARENKALAAVLPISLSEWRAELSPGEMIERRTVGHDEANLLVHSQSIEGRNLYAPLFIDMHPIRRNMPVTWRRLTVGENLAIVRRDAAVGYRAQVGQWQWMIYRSLGIQGNRTLLGQNYSTEFVCCRFNADGGTEDILEVQ